MRSAFFSISFALIWSSGCKAPNPLFCDSVSDCDNGEYCDLTTNNCAPNPPDAGLSCISDVECTNPQTPICDDDRTCRGCQLDVECASGVCRADGACELADAIVYASASGITAGTCPEEMPCDLQFALSRTDSSHSTVHLAEGTYASETLVIDFAFPLTIVGSRGVVLRRPIQVTAGATLTIRDLVTNSGMACGQGSNINVRNVVFDNPVGATDWLTLSGCVAASVEGSSLFDSSYNGIQVEAGSTDIQVSNTEIRRSMYDGIRFVNGGKLTMKDSVIEKSGRFGVVAQSSIVSIYRSQIGSNYAGGVSSVGGSFDIVNNIVFQNGNAVDGTFGGLRLESAGENNRVQHNTIQYNDCDVAWMPPLAGGLYCVGGSAANNIIAGNYRGNTDLPYAQFGGTCDTTGSYIGPPSTAPLYLVDYRITEALSAAVNTGITLTTPITEDFDQQPRADGMPDIGADEFYP